MEMTLLPIVFLAIENDEERDFVIEIFHSYKRLFYKVAIRYFSDSPADVDDAVSSAIEDICRYVSTIQKVPRNNLPAYMLSIIERACVRKAATMAKYRQLFLLEDMSALSPQHVSRDSDMDTVFAYANALDLLEAYGKKLSGRDKLLIRMRHIDMMEYAEMAKVLQVSEGAVRTALSRAKQRLQDAATSVRGG